MKKLLLNTHVWLWWLNNDPHLGEKTLQTIADPRNQVFISAASTWEISIKSNIGKLKAPEDMDSIVDDEGFSKLPISLFHGQQAGKLADHHQDPFDRMLIAQAQAEGLTLVTNDLTLQKYGIALMNPEL